MPFLLPEIQVIRLIRPLRCPEWCDCCYRQEMEVQSPPGTTIGWIKQDLTWLTWNTWMSIQDASGQTVLKIKGPCCTCDWCETEFQVTANSLSLSLFLLFLPLSHSHTHSLLPPSPSLPPLPCNSINTNIMFSDNVS